MTKREMEIEVSLRVGCLLYAVGKQPSMTLINLGRKREVKMMMMMREHWKIFLSDLLRGGKAIAFAFPTILKNVCDVM